MKIVIAPDSFKESLTALQVAEAIESGFKKVYPDATYCKIPMADGGEGTVQSLIDATQGEIIQVNVTAPLGNRAQGFFGLSGDGQTAIVEMAAASGLDLVPMAQRNPLLTTSFGTGELIKTALDHKVKKIILGLGGSATNDGGAGMLQALGMQLLDKSGQPLPYGGAALAELATIDTTQLDPRLQHVEFEVACDVTNPLCGKSGASAVFGPQKGADESMVAQLDNALAHFADIVRQQLEKEIANVAGAGAAGGMGAALQLMPHHQLKPGIQIVIESTRLAEQLQDADLVITGEGRMDSQSIHGKTPVGVALCAKQFNKPVIAIVGSLREDYETVYDHGIDAVFPIIRGVAPLAEILKQGAENLTSTAQNIARIWKLS